MEMKATFNRVALAFVVCGFTAMSGVAFATDAVDRSVQTLLPNGHTMSFGGVVDGHVSDVASDLSSALPVPDIENMLHPRVGHTATVLPDGRVLIWGGTDDSGRVIETGEWFDPVSRKFTEAPDIHLLPRSGHTATVLSDGRLLVLGGRAEALGPLEEAEVWDWRTNTSELLPALLEPSREGNRASLMADGRVLIVGSDENDTTIYDPNRIQFFNVSSDTQARLNQPDIGAPQVTGTTPASGASDVALDALIALRFDPPLAPESANAASITLFGPHGSVAVRVVAAEGGRIVFVSPQQELFPASHYSLFVQNVVDHDGRALVWHTLEFDTLRYAPAQLDARLEYARSGGAAATGPSGLSLSNPSSSATSNVGVIDKSLSPADFEKELSKRYRFNKPLIVDAEFWMPDVSNLGGLWRTHRPLPKQISEELHLALSKNSRKAAWRSKRLRSGGTVLTGRVFSLNDKPIAGVLVRVGNRQSRTDREGTFVLATDPGHQQLLVDGSSVSSVGGSFGEFLIGVDIEAGKENPIKPIFLPKIRAQDWIEIPSPLTADLTVKSALMPGFEVKLPAGTILRGRDGKVVHRIATIPMPLDRTPINYPVNTPLHMTLQPGGMSVEGLSPGATDGIRFVYPNYGGEAPGRRAGFLNYDPVEKGWYTYGYGQVSADGLSVVPDPGTRIYSATGFGIYFGAAPPPESPPACNGAQDGDPVDLRTGLFKHRTLGPQLSDVLPLSWATSYRPGDAQNRDFGKGTSHNFGMYLYNPNEPHSEWQTIYLVLSDCSLIKFDQTGGRPAQTDFVAVHTETATSFYGATLTRTGDIGLRLTKRDGTMYDFTLSGGDLRRIQDRFGRSLEVSHNGGKITRVATESGRYVDVTYDSRGRISDLLDIDNRHWHYTYNAAGYLENVTYPDSTHESFSYDAQSRMTDVVDRRGNTMVHNTFDTAGRVSDQLLADGATYHFAYTTDAQGVVTRTDVTRPNGALRRVAFHASGYPSSDIEAFGTPNQRSMTYERDSIGFVTATVDALGRRTELTYDEDKHVTDVNVLAGTAESRTSHFTYTDDHDLASVTDPYGRQTSFVFDPRRHLERVQDSQGRFVRFEYDDLDRLTRSVDVLNRATDIEYDLYDVSAVTDPLLRKTKRFVDTLGRLTAVEDPLGLRTEIHYNINNDVVDVVDPSGATTASTYDPMGNQLTLTDAMNRTTTWTYDARQRPLTRTDALGKTESWTYAANETGMTFEDRGHRLTSAAFDIRGRLSDVVGSDGRHWIPTFDIGDRLLNLSDSAVGTTSFTYNAYDQMLSESGPAGDVAYTYDTHNRLASRTLSGQGPIVYDYDARDRLSSLTQGSESVGFGYDNADRRTTTTLPNGVKTTAVYDPADRLTSLTYKKSATVLGDFSYAYDNADRLIGRGGSFDSTVLPDATTAPGTSDANHRLTAFDGKTLTYDDYGNLVDDGVRTYQYDALDQLVGIQQAGIPVASFSYDSFGRRLSKTVDGSTTSYRYDGDNPVESSTGGCVFRSMPGRDSGPCRAGIPAHAGPPFRRMPAG
jgi:YD repeat-containing protein